MQESRTNAPDPERAGAMEELARDPSSRKRFLRMVGGAGAASAFAVFLAACNSDDDGGGGAGGSNGGAGARSGLP